MAESNGMYDIRRCDVVFFLEYCLYIHFVIQVLSCFKITSFPFYGVSLSENHENINSRIKHPMYVRRSIMYEKGAFC